jgi:HEPN domain-containing protein
MPLDPGSPAVWMQYAQSDLQLARTGTAPGVLYETLCFHLQQAVEKAIKAVLIAYQVPAPKAHNIDVLVGLLPVTLLRPSVLVEAATLTDYAVGYRYPGDEDPVTEDEYRKALLIADSTVKWAEAVLAQIASEYETGA